MEDQEVRSTTIKRVHAVVISDEEQPGRWLYLKSGFDKMFIEIYEDPVDLIIHHLPASDMPKGVIDLLKIKKAGNDDPLASNPNARPFPV